MHYWNSRFVDVHPKKLVFKNHLFTGQRSGLRLKCFVLFFLQPLLILKTFMLPDNQDDIVLRAVTISANLLASPDQYTEVFCFSKNCLSPTVAS